MNNLSVIENKGLSSGLWDSSQELTQIKEIYGKNLSGGEFSTLVQMGKATGLNPFLKEIWAVKYGDNPAQIFIGRDGYRKMGQRHPLYDYHLVDAVYSNDDFEVNNGEVSHKYNFQNRGILIGAYCIVQRKNASRPIYVFVELKEYSTNKSLWNSQTGKQATMIKKVAEAQGFRMAFQELFSGTYSEYEDWGNGTQVSTLKKPGKGLDGVKERLGLVEKPEEKNEEEIAESEIVESEPSLPFITIEEVKNKIQESNSISELAKIRNFYKQLTTQEEKSEMSNLWKKREEEILSKT